MLAHQGLKQNWKLHTVLFTSASVCLLLSAVLKFNKLALLCSDLSVLAFSDSEETPLSAYYLKCLENLVQQLNSS